MTPRDEFVDWAYKQVGRPVIWNGKGDFALDGDGVRVTLPESYFAFDCSGLVMCGVREVTSLDLRHKYNAQKLWDELPPIDDAKRQAGDLGFFGPSMNAVLHVVIFDRDNDAISADGATRIQWRWTASKDPALPYPDDLRTARMLRAIDETRSQNNVVRAHKWPMRRPGYLGARRNIWLEGTGPER